MSIHTRLLRKKALPARIAICCLPLLALVSCVALSVYLLQQSAAHHKSQAQQREEALEDLRLRVTDTADALFRHYLHGVIKTAQEMATTLNDDYLAGILTDAEAKATTAKILQSCSIGRNGYVFAVDSKGIVQFHRQPQLVGADLSNDHLVAQWLDKPEGFHIQGELDDEGTSGTVSASFITRFAPWDWIIAAVVQEEEFFAIADRNQLLHLLNLANPGNGGFTYLLSLQQGEGSVSLAPSENSDELRQIAVNIRRVGSGQITYRIQEPAGKGVVGEKIAVFRKLEDLGLIYGMAIDLEPVPWRPDRSAWIFICSVLAALAMTAAAALAASYGLTRPLAKLVRRVQDELPEGLDLSTVIGSGEADILGAVLDQFHCALQESRQQFVAATRNGEAVQARLDAEILSSRETQDNLIAEITSRKEAVEKLSHEVAIRKSAETYLQLFKNIFDNAIEGILITDREARILTVNQSFTTLTGYSSAESVGQNPKFLQSGRHSKHFYSNMWKHLLEKGSWSGEIWNKKKNGAIFPEWLSISAIVDDHNRVTHYFAFIHDMSEIKKKEQLISFMAYHDTLTKLPNRAALEARLSKAISHARRYKQILAIFFIDLDNFKNINDSLGHDKGDELLVRVSRRLSTTIRDEDTLSRLGGDEFIILTEDVGSENTIFVLANRILESFKTPFELDSRTVYISASIGISVFPNDGSTIQELIKNADIAMYKAKGEGRNKFMMFTQEMNEKLRMHMRIENAIRTGLKKREFVVFYQPKISLMTEMPASFEALIRWEKGGRHIGPDQFIPVAEESGLIDEMGLYVLEETCGFLRKLKEHGMERPISINISPRTFNNTEIVENIDEVIERYGIEHKYIEFEITETTAMTDVEHTIRVMHRFRERGIHFSIDDFGTGYSSLSYLNVMPVSTLKIDKRFISTDEINSRGIVSTIVAIAQQMHLNVVAEGVETSAQLNWLRKIGCNEVQGYFFAKPMHPEKALQYLYKHAHPPEK